MKSSGAVPEFSAALDDAQLYSGALYPRCAPAEGLLRERVTRSKFERIQSAVRAAPGMRILEFGCDHGILLRMLEREGAECYGVDINADAVAQAAHPRVFHAPAECVPFADAGFDACVSSHVIEHLEQPQAMLREAARVTRAGGILALLYPWELFRGMTVIPDLVISGRMPHFETLRRIHRHVLTPDIVRELAGAVGWKEESSGSFWGFPYLVPQFYTVLRRRDA